MSKGAAVKRILILAAGPKDMSPLGLPLEVRDINEALRRSNLRSQFEVVECWAARSRDMRRALLEIKPSIVHFCGHGEGAAGLILEDETGKKQPISTEALTGLFQEFAAQIECVVLNACFSEVQAEAISQHISYVVGMNQAIGDKSAIEFAVGFYDALGAEENASIEQAYRLGCNAIALTGSQYRQTPVLRKKPGLEPVSKGVFISYRNQKPDSELAQTFYDALQAAGHRGFMAGGSIRLGEAWAQRIREELEACDYLLLLLSPQSIVSEMVIGEVRRAKELREQRTPPKPTLLPIRINFPLDASLNYELRGYLNQIQQREWHAPADTPKILQEVISLVSGRGDWGTGSEKGSAHNFVQPTDDRPDDPPLPVAEPELQREPGGAVPLISGLYVERPPSEADCFQEILQPGALIRIKAPRQMGKTSLMARILNHAKEQGYQTIGFSFQRADSVVFTSLDQLLYWFCEQVGRRLKCLTQLEDRWKQKGGSKDKCYFYFLECLLGDLDVPLVVGIDEVDLVFPHPTVADDFFGLLRSWFDAARCGDMDSEFWEKLRLVIVHSTEVYVPLDIRQSPFNVGKNVELLEFNQAQVWDLARRYQLSWKEHQVEQLMLLVGGHPYLVRKALYHLRRQDVTLENLRQTAPTESGIYSDHLRRHLLNLQTYPALAEALRQVVVGGKPVKLNAELAFKLESMGLITLNGNEASTRCELYRSYFYDHLRT